MILTYIISNSKEEAESIALDLMEKRLVYSINIISDIKSIIRDDDNIKTVNRTIVLAKTKALLYSEIEKEIKKVQTSGSVITFSMPLTQMSDDLFNNIQKYTLKA